MAAYQTGQEFDDLRWGTGMPVTVRVGGEIVRARARGKCSVTVANPVQLAERVPDPEGLSTYMRSQVVLAVTDMLGERSMQVASAAQFTAVDPAALQALREQLEPRLAAMGLQLKTVNIEAIEIV